MIEIELIVGTMGLDNILNDKLPKYSQALLGRAASVLKDFRSSAVEFGDSNTPRGMPDDEFKISDFEKLSKKILEDAEIMEAAQGLETWPSELQMPVMVLVADIKAYLTEQLPQSQVVGTLSGFSLPPSDSDQFRFLWQANLVDDIRHFGTLLNAGAITTLESTLMRTLFPQTHDYLVIELLDQLMEAAVSGKIVDWEGSWRMPAFASLLGVQIASFEDVMQMQTGMAEKTAGRPKGPGAIQIAQMNQTENQAMDARTIDQK